MITVGKPLQVEKVAGDIERVGTMAAIAALLLTQPRPKAVVTFLR